MKSILAALVFLLAAATSYADPVLLGKWRSDKTLTMGFAIERAKLEDKTVRFLDQMMGRMTLTFSRSRVTSVMPDWESETVEGVKSSLVGFSETHAYKVVATTPTQVAVVSMEPVTDRRTITVYNFEDKDTMWVYLGGPTFPQMNIREYFVRDQ